MDYPIWEPFIANSLIIAIVAILHVFVSHFAIGGGLYLVLAEIWARAKGDTAHLEYIKNHSRFFILTTLVFGVVTGVGIWITIGLIHPTGTKWLINNFVWGWATEWVAFFVEIAAAIIYYYGWKKMSARIHIAIGWIYFIAAWLSLFIINGIITMMLTPGDWVITGNFWDGFFNPTFWPSLIFRTFICLTLAGLYASLTVAKEKNIDLKIRIQRRNGLIILGPLVLALLSGLWYYNSLPEEITALFIAGSVPSIALQVSVFSALLLFVFSFLATIVFPRRSGYISAGILMMFGLLWMGGFEWTREAIRKPYIISGFLYSNNVLASETGRFPPTEPMTIKYSTGDRGRDLYLAGCRSCHTHSGYMALDKRLAGLSTDHIENIIPRLQYFKGPMPPFAGNDEDLLSLTQYLHSIAAPDPLTTNDNLSQSDRTKIVFDRRCGGCHTLNRFRPIGEVFTDIDFDEAREIILELEDLADEMPPFTGGDEELKLLINYLTRTGDD